MTVTLAAQRGYEIVHEYTDRISGAKAKRPWKSHKKIFAFCSSWRKMLALVLCR